MTTFLDYPECWKGATRFYHADTLNARYWRKRNHMGYRAGACDEASIALLANMIRDHFHHTEGRGNNCIVEAFRRGELVYFFAYPEDFSQHSIEWVGGEFGRRPHNPAFEIVFVYGQKEGTLDINYQGSYKAVEALQKMFAIAILKMNDLPPNMKDSRVYDLNPIRHRDFSFTYTLGGGITGVFVKQIRFTSRLEKGVRITFEVDPYQNPHAIYDQIEQANKSIPLHLYNVTQVVLIVNMIVHHDKPPKSFTIRLAYPNSCSLKYDEVGIKLREMLKASGVEPKQAIVKTQAEESVEA
jgi:hypothetical protein